MEVQIGLEAKLMEWWWDLCLDDKLLDFEEMDISKEYMTKQLKALQKKKRSMVNQSGQLMVLMLRDK